MNTMIRFHNTVTAGKGILTPLRGGIGYIEMH